MARYFTLKLCIHLPLAHENKLACSEIFHHYHTLKVLFIYVTGFGKIRLNAANNFFQYHGVKPYGSIFFEKFFMAEMDRQQLALAYDAVVSSGML